MTQIKVIFFQRNSIFLVIVFFPTLQFPFFLFPTKSRLQFSRDSLHWSLKGLRCVMQKMSKNRNSNILLIGLQKSNPNKPLLPFQAFTLLQKELQYFSFCYCFKFVKLFHAHSGVNFINNLLKAFTHIDPKRTKMTVKSCVILRF